MPMVKSPDAFISISCSLYMELFIAMIIPLNKAFPRRVWSSISHRFMSECFCFHCFTSNGVPSVDAESTTMISSLSR